MFEAAALEGRSADPVVNVTVNHSPVVVLRVPGSLVYIDRVFPLLGLRFISVSDGFDSDKHKGEAGGLELAFTFLIHEWYSRDLSKKNQERKAGEDAARRVHYEKLLVRI